MNIIGGGQTPYYKKVMGFIDDSNLLIELSKELGIDFRADKPPLPALSIALLLINHLIHGAFFERGLSEDLALAVDDFNDIIKRQNVNFGADPWSRYVSEIKIGIQIK